MSTDWQSFDPNKEVLQKYQICMISKMQIMIRGLDITIPAKLYDS